MSPTTAAVPRLDRRTVAITAAVSLALAIAGVAIGRSAGADQPPRVPQVSVKELERPEVGDTVVIPSAVEIPREAPRD